MDAIIETVYVRYVDDIGVNTEELVEYSAYWFDSIQYVMYSAFSS